MAHHILQELYDRILARKGADAETSYTASLLDAGVEKIGRKLSEEALETVIAGLRDDKQEVAQESADVLYHLLVLWAAAGVTPDDVYAELKGREGQSGLEEKKGRIQ